MHILGISCFYHDSAACILQSGEIVAAAQEERFTRTKHDSGFPYHSVRYCLPPLCRLCRGQTMHLCLSPCLYPKKRRGHRHPHQNCE